MVQSKIEKTRFKNHFRSDGLRYKIVAMYCIQFLLPVLLLPRPAHPYLLIEHSMFLSKFHWINKFKEIIYFPDIIFLSI